MNAERVIEVFQHRRVRFLLIGGVNYLLRHRPVLTYDVDLWIEDSPENRALCEQALADLGAEWGRDDADWAPVKQRMAGWLDGQLVFCLASAAGAVDVFRSVRGLGCWAEAFARSVEVRTASGIACRGLCDEDMLACQMALDESEQKLDRIRDLRRALGRESP